MKKLASLCLVLAVAFGMLTAATAPAGAQDDAATPGTAVTVAADRAVGEANPSSDRELWIGHGNCIHSVIPLLHHQHFIVVWVRCRDEPTADENE